MRTDDSETAGVTAGMHGEKQGGASEETWPNADSQYVLSDGVFDAGLFASLLQNATLPERMRAAADTLEAANIRYDTAAGIPHEQAVDDAAGIPWDAIRLRESADRWEAADKEAAAKEGLVQELAKTLFDAGWHKVRTEQARALIDDGWTKGLP